jgi:fructokinase
MQSKSKIFCIGELLIDFFCTDVNMDLVEGSHFEKQAGGAPANVCATIAKLGGSAHFCGKVGNDPFGYFLEKTLMDLNVDTSMVVHDEKYPTTLAFVSLKENGERDFVFNRGADAYLSEEDINQGNLKVFKIFHFGSATALLEEPFQSTYLNLMKTAREKGKFVSFDPNFRHDLWKGKKSDFIDFAKKGMAMADFVKVSEEELYIISGLSEVKYGINALHQLGANVVAVTLGKEGTMISNQKQYEKIPSININAIDTTGAGDAFVGATLFQLSLIEEPNKILEDFQNLKQIISFSNRVGAIVCTKVGAISSIPTIEEVNVFQPPINNPNPK